MPDRRAFETIAVHGEPEAGPVDFLSTVGPIYPSNTFTHPSSAQTHAALVPGSEGFAYTRNANPTVRALERTVACLEATDDAVVFASGMAAFHCGVLACQVRPGDTILAAEELYGGSRGILAGLFADLGIRAVFVDVTDLELVRRYLAETGAAMLCFEPIANPLLTVADIAELTSLAHDANAAVLVDSTFASPYLVRPRLLGADMVMHSASKYLGGHGDVIAGVLAGEQHLMDRARQLRTSSGGVLGPFEAWLVQRGVKTLALRMRAHCDNAAALAGWLRAQGFDCVCYPGANSRSERELVERQFLNGLGGGLVTFDSRFDPSSVERFMDALRVAVPGTSLGETATLVLYPAMSSHRALTPEQRSALGITDGLLRVSVGLEHIDDITSDFEQALRVARG
jgi:cystathionine beta-lyase/cystathionine gamma-synthase